ncbi:LamG-like jellyroll fold domain-containing protein [Plantactinospora sp. DSM 117369]
MRSRALWSRLSVLLLMASTLLVVAPPASSDAAIPNPTVLFTRGMGGYDCIRGAKLVPARDGTLIAIGSAKYRNETGECPDLTHTDIVMRRRALDGTWGPLVKIRSNPKGDGRMLSATPVVDQRTGNIMLFVRDGSDTDFDESVSYVLTSDDNGQTWPETARYPWVTRPGPSHGIQLEHGPHARRLVVAMWLDTTPQKTQLIYSDDGGVSWTRGATSTGEWSGEPSIFERNDGAIYVMARNQGAEDLGDTKTFGISADGGETFTGPFQVVDNLVAPKVYGTVLRLRSTLDGDKYDRVLFSSPAEYRERAGSNTKDRHRMVIRSSYTEGRTWQGVNDSDSQTIHTGPASYTSMAELPDGRIALAFEAGDEGQVSHHEVRFTTFTEADLGLPDDYSGGTGTPDTSGLGNTARIRGTTHGGDGRFDGGVTLDGVDDHVQVPFAESLAVDDADFTTMAWLKYNATTGNHPIFWAYGVGDDRSQMWLRAEPGSNRIQGRVQSGANGGSVMSSSAYNDGTWHHIAFQRQGTTLRLFVDGTLTGTATGPTSTVSPGRPFQMDIGQRIDGAQHLAGSLDEVRLYQRALTEAEIDRIHANNAVNVPGALLRLPFHPNFKTTDDTSANNNDGFVRQAVPGPGRFGNAMTFDGVEDRVHIPYSNATNLGSSQFTITTWVKYSGGTARQTLLWAYGVNESNSQLWIRADPANNTITTSARTPTGVVRIDTDKAYADNAWHFLALRRTDSQLILSIDGENVGTAPAPTGSLTAGHTDGVQGIHLGEKLDGTDTFTGALDELHLYSRALSDAELDAMRADNTTPTNGLALHLPLNDTNVPAP